MTKTFDPQRVPINATTLRLFRDALDENIVNLGEDLILEKNREYGDSWQSEGPFVAAGRLKDKIIRVESILDDAGKRGILQTTYEGGFENILETMAYATLLALYWVHNDLGVSKNAPESVQDFYSDLKEYLVELQGESGDGDGSGEAVAED